VNDFLISIGLEVHVQLKTKTKMFCSCAVDPESPPNTNICPVCTGQPGVLPVKNEEAVLLGIRAGLALNCKIEKFSVFARKNYFYPDLPKAYQISQYELPVASGGYIKAGGKKIRLVRAHLEEDAGKLLHAIGSEEVDGSLVDLNRCGTPLLEIVSEPDIDSPQLAFDYLKSLRRLMRYAGISDCDMEKGSLRCDCNISIRRCEDEPLGVKAEIKNMNSFKELKDAAAYEIERQKKLLDSGGKVVQETRLWNSSKGRTFSMRSKEEASDYRYFPDPDLKPIYVSGEMLEIEKAGLPELPGAVKERFMNQGLTEYQADILTDEKVLADYFDKIIAGLTPDGQEEAANIVISNLLAEANQSNLPLDAFLNSVKPAYICELVKFRQEGKINKQVLKTIFPKMIKEQKAPRELIKDVNIVSDESEIVKLVEDAIRANASSWEDYRAGKEKASGRIVSHVMKESRGAADPATVMRILKRMAGE